MILDFLAAVFGASYWSGKFLSEKMSKAADSMAYRDYAQKYKREYEPHFATKDDEKRLNVLVWSKECFNTIGEDFAKVVGSDYMQKYDEYLADKNDHKDWLGHRYNKWALNLLLAREGKIPREFDRYSTETRSYDGPGHRISTTATKEDIEFCKILEKHLVKNGINARFVFRFDTSSVYNCDDDRVKAIADSQAKYIPEYCWEYGNIVLDTQAYRGGYRLW